MNLQTNLFVRAPLATNRYHRHVVYMVIGPDC